MNYFVPYVEQSELEDILVQQGYEPAKHNNGYIHRIKHYQMYPRHHLHVVFHKQDDLVVLQLHFDKYPHHETDESSVYMDDRLIRELKKLERTILYRLAYKARERGIKRYGTVNIYREPTYKKT